jgi:S1-C subfamily serine protease
VIRPWVYASSLVVACFALLATCGACASVVPRPGKSAVRPAAVALEVSVECTGKHRGSGVLVGPRRILTAAHVVPCGEAAHVVVTTPDGYVVPAHVTYTDDANDVAVIVPGYALPGPYPTVTSVGTGRVCIFSAVPERRVTCGVIRTVKGTEIDHAADTRYGNSGSGLYDAHGRLVGIVTTRWQHQPGGTARALRVEVLP